MDTASDVRLPVLKIPKPWAILRAGAPWAGYSGGGRPPWSPGQRRSGHITGRGAQPVEAPRVSIVTRGERLTHGRASSP